MSKVLESYEVPAEEIRPAVMVWAQAMEAVLRQHDGEKGRHPQCHLTPQVAGLRNEMAEFEGALDALDEAREVGGEAYQDALRAARHECIDVANRAMMCFDALSAKLEPAAVGGDSEGVG